MENKTESDKIKDIKSRFQELDNTRSRFIDRWLEAQKYTGFSVYDWYNLDSIPTFPKRFTSAPCNFLSILISGLVGYSISPNITWFKLALENTNLLKLYGVKDWLEEVEEIMNAEFNRSNLYQQAERFIEDSACIGHGVMLCGGYTKDNKLHYTTMRSNEIYLDANEDGEIDTVYRRFLITLRNAVDFFGLDNLDESLQEAYKDPGKWNNKIEILHVVQPRKNYDSEKKDNKNMPYESVYIDFERQKIITESGFNENPYAVFEWKQIPGFAYSESPVMGAMSDIKALNLMEETRLKIAQTSAEPPMRVTQGVKNISLVPKGFTYIRKDEVIEPIKTGENYPVTLDVVEKKKEEVKDWFNVDFFLMLQQRQGQMTATEVIELQGEKAAVLSNLIVNLNAALQKIIERSFNILMRNQRLPSPPESLQNQNVSMKIDFMGPLAQSQKKYHTMGGIQAALSLASPIMQMFPNSGDFIDADELMKRAMEGQGMPQAVIREDNDVKKIREDRVQQQKASQEEEQRQEMMNNIMSNAASLNQPVQNGSVMAELNDQLAGGLENA